SEPAAALAASFTPSGVRVLLPDQSRSQSAALLVQPGPSALSRAISSELRVSASSRKKSNREFGRRRLDLWTAADTRMAIVQVEIDLPSPADLGVHRGIHEGPHAMVREKTGSSARRPWHERQRRGPLPFKRLRKREPPMLPGLGNGVTQGMVASAQNRPPAWR